MTTDTTTKTTTALRTFASEADGYADARDVQAALAAAAAVESGTNLITAAKEASTTAADPATFMAFARGIAWGVRA